MERHNVSEIGCRDRFHLDKASPLAAEVNVFQVIKRANLVLKVCFAAEFE